MTTSQNQVKSGRKLTAEQEQARDARRARQQELFTRLARMGESERAILASRCPIVTCDGHELSIANMCLIAMQRPNATVVGGFRQWLRHGRCVRKGEHGACIRIPAGRGRPATDTAPEEPGDVFFVAGTVFDVSQTEELESIAPAAMLEMEVA